MSNKQPSTNAKPRTKQVQRLRYRRLTDEPPAPPPTIENDLPDLAGDDQHNVLPRDAQLGGIRLSIPRWFPLADPGGTPPEIDTVFFYADGRLLGFYEYAADTDPVPPDPVVVDLLPAAVLKTHGIKEITYKIEHANTNVAQSEIETVFVDTIDPNFNNIPPPINLPADLSGDVTPAYLAGKVGLVCSIPRLDDSRPGDTWTAWFGTQDTLGESGNFPDTGPAEVTFASAKILGFGPGIYEVRYRATDRAGNTTQTSITRPVAVRVSEPPVLGTLSVVEGPLVNKEEARNGVTIELSMITNYLSDDIVRVFWEGTLIYNQPVGLFPIFPLEFSVAFPTIAGPGELYTANIECTVSRAPAPVTTTVDVDLVEPGTGNPGPGPVDANLDPPVVRGGNEMLENQLVEEDRGEDATASFTIPANLVLGDFIDIIYGTGAGMQGETYAVTGSEAADFLVELKIAWTIIENYGNGKIPCYYRIRNAVNYKHSPSQDVEVSIYSLSGLADAKFSVVSSIGTLTCDDKLNPRPWEGTPIFIKDTATLKENDLVTVHAVRYAFADNTTPTGDTVESPEQQVSFNDVQNGFTVTLDLGAWFRAHTASGGRGWVGVTWSIFRPSTGDRGVSNEVQVKWDFRVSAPPLNTCVPGATRAHGTL